MEGHTFVPPPEAPVFEPTEEEFQDPLAFITKIRPYVEKVGICKIRPPPEWQPPFSVDVEKFRFTPRVQKLNELEATTRVKFNFLDAIAKFWELQGTSLKLPMVDKKNLDIFKLYKTVHEEGGYEYVTTKRKWPVVARKMGYLEIKSVPACLRNHYEKLLFPYDVFQSGLMTDTDPTPEPKPTRTPKAEPESRMRKSARQIRQEQVQQSIDYSRNPELKKLQFLAPGPKMTTVCESDSVKEEMDTSDNYQPSKSVKIEPETVESKDIIPSDEDSKSQRRRPVRKASKKMLQDHNPGLFQDDYLCHMCSSGDDGQYLLLCDGCDASFHTYCLIPPITTVPKGEWRCPKCIAQEYDKPIEMYGFEQSKKEYNLQSFGEMADKFKADYFGLPPESVPYDVAEKEFWRLVGSVDEEVSIEYGADLHTAVHGSGFPVKENVTNNIEEFYANSKWNLNNLPTLPNSVLSHVCGNISGMKVPWIYVGMCFSSFCWHTEDHWSYSINYLHWGEPKTWYGIPGDCAEMFENVVQEIAPELFEAHPDLLHHLVTIVNPNVLMTKGVPVVRTNQEAGEFIVTFPRSYHAGFNQGYNLAEAVNFATADWLSMGHLCVSHYRRMNRTTVFSHEELVCNMAANPDNLDLSLAKAIYDDMVTMVDQESKLHKELKDKGVVETKRQAFELMPDDERQCSICNTTCFLSAVTCPCDKQKLSCIRCASEHCSECDIESLIIRHRYSLDELQGMLAQLKKRADSFDNWENEVRQSLDASAGAKVSLSVLRELVTTAEQSQFPECGLLEELKVAVAEAERCGNVATQLVTKKHRTRTADVLSNNTITPSLNLEELQEFCRQLQRLPCIIDQAELVQDLMNRVESFQSEAQEILCEAEPSAIKLKQLLDTAIALDVDLPEIPKLKQELHQCRWLEKVEETLQDTRQVSLDVLRELLDEASMLTKKQIVEKSTQKLRSLVNTCEEWESKAKLCLQARPRHLMSSIQAIIREASLVPVHLPNIDALKEALDKAREWSNKVDHVQNDEYYPYLQVLDALVMRGRPIPVRLEQLPQMESQVAAAIAWRDRTGRTFLKKNSSSSLLEILSCRKDIGVYKLLGKQRRKKDKDREKERDIIDLADLEDYIDRKPSEQSALFRVAKQKELQEMRDLRKRNLARFDDLNSLQPENRQFCVCRKAADGYMLQCELCKEWFHSTCVPLPRTPSSKGTTKNVPSSETSRTLKYLCPLCHRSRRPRLETILSLLVSLQKLPVRLAEGEALQFLTERAMNWQDRVRQFLLIGNVSKVWQKILLAETLKQEPNAEGSSAPPPVTTTTLLQQNMAMAITAQTQKTLQENAPPVPNASAIASENTGMEIDVVGNTQEGCKGVSDGNEDNTEVENDNEGDSGCVEIKLSQHEVDEVEDYMMEGDLLEVTLDETETLWKILVSQRKQTEQKIQLVLPKKTEEKKRRKRKKNDEKLHDKENTAKVNKKFKQKKNKKLLDDDPDRPKRKYVRKQKKAEIVDVEGDDDDDEDEACLARPCKHPSSDEVDWVQCDTCEQWYHNLCVGITAETAAELDSYVCPYCNCSHDPLSNATSPDSNIDVVSTTPHATTPRSPRSPTSTKQHPAAIPLPEAFTKSPTLTEQATNMNPMIAVER
ncbi:lysine-specific demethylase 5A-like [Dendronephthya gigantea]|uniref:lysine-specific demethylase 5A-like n=1 Tax=Dendronephthya gigantea TaxID=151771 RepID=UPI00106AE53B|nr:lysine-specific demethylase 5A-like [Dendronephthya gigantea]